MPLPITSANEIDIVYNTLERILKKAGELEATAKTLQNDVKAAMKVFTSGGQAEMIQTLSPRGSVHVDTINVAATSDYSDESDDNDATERAAKLRRMACRSFHTPTPGSDSECTPISDAD